VQLLTLRPVESSLVVVSVFGDEDDNEAELRERIVDHATHLMAWNQERIARGRLK